MASSKKPYRLDEKVVKAAIDAALSAVKVDDMHVQIRGQHKRHLRFARNGVTTSGDIDEATCVVTAVVGTRHASVEVKGLDQRLLQEAAARAKAAAELCPEDPEYVPYGGAVKLAPVTAAFHEKTALLTPLQIADAIAPAIAEARSRNLNAAGFYQYETSTLAIGTKAGFFGTHQYTLNNFSMTARTQDGTGSGWSGREAESLTELDIKKLGILACDKAERSRSPRALAAGTYPVVLEPAATGELLSFLARALNRRAADEGNSPFSAVDGKSKLGEKILGDLTLVSDPYDKRLPAAPFDGEGVPRQRQVFVENGVLKSLYTSRYWAKKTNTKADGAPAGFSAHGPSINQDLVAGLDKGLLVTRFWYCNAVDPKTLTMTGLTRDGVFWVEDGHIVDAVNNFRFNQSILQMFVDTEAYGPTERGDGIAPAIRCSAFTMSTKSDAV